MIVYNKQTMPAPEAERKTKMQQRLFQITVIAVFFMLGTAFSRKPPVTLFTIGDSTMASYSADRYPLTGWCQVLQPFFDEQRVRVKNRAISGFSTKSFLDRGHWQAVLDSLMPGDYVFIQFGHNDQKIERPDKYADADGRYRENLTRMVLEARDRKAIPVLMTPIARRRFGENGKLVDTHGRYPDVVREVSDSLEVMLIDMNRLTTAFVNRLGEEASKEVYLWTPPEAKFPEGRMDNTHLSPRGAAAFAQLAVLELADRKSGLRKFVIRKKETK